MNDLHLSKLPAQAKWLITLMLTSFMMTHLFAAMLVFEVTTHVNSSAKEFFAYKTLASMLRMAHQHTFGHGTMYFLTSAVFLLARPRNAVAIPLITGLFVGAWLDQASWFLLKYSSERWEWLSRAAGTMYGLCFLVIVVLTLTAMWSTPKTVATGRN